MEKEFKKGGSKLTGFIAGVTLSATAFLSSGCDYVGVYTTDQYRYPGYYEDVFLFPPSMDYYPPLHQRPPIHRRPPIYQRPPIERQPRIIVPPRVNPQPGNPSRPFNNQPRGNQVPRPQDNQRRR